MPTTLNKGRRSTALLAVVAVLTSLVAFAAPAAALDTAACPAATIPDAPFTDLAGVPPEAQDAIDCIAYYGVSGGTSPTTFSPFADVARWQMALFLRATLDLKVELPSGASGPFMDLTGVPDAAVEAINQLYAMEVAAGTSATTFDPFSDVQRWQMALFLRAVLVEAGRTMPSGASGPFTDLAGVPDAAVEAINQLYALGVTAGTSATTFDPFSDVARWQMALFLAATLQAAGVVPAQDLTAAPELVSVVKGSNGIVVFNFDTAIPGQSLTAEDFRLYDPTGTYANPGTLSISGQSVIARFTTGEVAGAIRAGVRSGAVETGTGLPSIAGDYPLSASAMQVSPIDPNLVSVGNYRFSDEITLGTQLVLVDFVFDDAGNTVGAGVAAIHGAGDTDEAFTLIGLNGQVFPALETQEPVVDHDGTTTTVTVAFASDPTDVPQSQLRRGVLQAVGTSEVIWSANFGATNGVTVDPDLQTLSQEGSTDIFRFGFDEAVSDTTLDPTGFMLVDAAGTVHTATVVSRLADATAATVRAQFPTFDPDTDVAIHGFVTEGAVTATDSTDSDFAGQNRAASQPVTIPTMEDPAPGVTAVPDLVSAQRFRDTVTGRFSIALTFDQSIASVAPLDIVLYDDAGVAFAVDIAGPGISVSGSTVTITSENLGLSDDAIEATVTVAVQTTTLATNPPEATEGQVDARSLTNN